MRRKKYIKIKDKPHNQNVFPSVIEGPCLQCCTPSPQSEDQNPALSNILNTRHSFQYLYNFRKNRCLFDKY